MIFLFFSFFRALSGFPFCLDLTENGLVWFLVRASFRLSVRVLHIAAFSIRSYWFSGSGLLLMGLNVHFLIFQFVDEFIRAFIRFSQVRLS